MPSGVRAPLLNQLSSIPISPFPPAEVRSKLSQDEWNASLEAWITITRVFLSLPAKEFSSAQLASLASFLHSYFTELAATTGHDVTIHDSKALDLRSSCYFLAHRTLSEPSPPSILLHWDFLAKLSRAFPRSESLRKLLRSLRESSQVEQTLKKTNDSLVKALDSGSLEAEETLIQLVPLIRTSPDMGAFLMTGADLLDSLCSAYPNASSSLRKKLVAIAYLGLVSLIKVETPNQSSLLDHLYSMRSNVETMQNPKSKKQEERRDHLLSDLVTNTPIVHVIEEMLSGPDAARAKNLKSALAAYGTPQPHFRNGHVSRKSNKGKAKANDEEYEQEIHAHQMSLVSQIQDLFPDLGSGFIVKLLHEYNDDVEQVTAHLLEDTLPPHLAQSDRTIELPLRPSHSRPSHSRPSQPPPSFPTRRNIHDHDALDRLQVPTTALHRGRTSNLQTADTLLSDRSSIPSKSAIFAALAAFDPDSDEHDDTYDADDAAAAPDPTLPDPDEIELAARRRRVVAGPGPDADAGSDTGGEAVDAVLFRAYKATPEVFERDASTRRGQLRAKLRAETQMTDEAIEGWAVMLSREPARLRRLERRFAMGSGGGMAGQRELGKTAWRGGTEGEDEEEDEEGMQVAGGSGSGDQNRGRGGARGRGRGRGGFGGEGSDSHGSRQRKEVNKGSRANHNRRNQRARKVARAGFPG